MANLFYGIRVTGNVSGPGIKERIPVQTISLVNQNLANNLVGTVISGYTLASGDRFILAGQTTGSQNGVYVAAAISYRAEDYESGDSSQCFMTVTSGTYAGSVWQATASGVIGTSTQGFVLTKWTQYSVGNIEYANSSNTRALLAPPSTATSYLQMTTAGLPSWSNIIGVPNGGTGVSSLTSGALLLGAGTSAITTLAPTIYKMLVSNGTPAYALSNTSYLSSINGGSYGVVIANTIDVTTSTTNAVNYLSLSNAFTTANPIIAALGSDTNVGINIQPQGTGAIGILSTATNSGTLNLYQRNGSNYVGLQAATTIPSSITFVLPATYGTSGQFLQTNGAGILSFANVPSNVTNTSLITNPVIVSNMTQQSIAVFSYVVARYGSAAVCALYFESVFATAFNVVIVNVTASSTISTTTISTSGFQTITFTAPSVNSRISFEVIKNATGTSSSIQGLQLAIN